MSFDVYRSKHHGETVDEVIDSAKGQPEINERVEERLSEIESALPEKVDKVQGKKLSSNDYTDEERQKLMSLPTKAKLDERFNGVEEALGHKYEKPSTGISKEDLSLGVNESLEKADSALQQEDITNKVDKGDFDAFKQSTNDALDRKYEKPFDGIPQEHLDESVKKSLEKADSALQQEDIDGKVDKEVFDSFKEDSREAIEKKADKTEIPDVSHFATREELSQSGTEMKAWVEDKNYLTEHQSLAGLVADIQYNKGDKAIYFFDKSGEKMPCKVDTTDFIKDGMVESVMIADGSLVITFNTDSGHEAISIPLSDIFNPDNYYSKEAMDVKLAEYASKEWVEGKHFLTAPDIEGKLDKTEFSTFRDENAAELARKADKGEIPDVSGFATKDELSQEEAETKEWVEGKHYLSEHQDISGKEDSANKVIEIGDDSTDKEYPSAKAVREFVSSRVSVEDEMLVLNI